MVSVRGGALAREACWDANGGPLRARCGQGDEKGLEMERLDPREARITALAHLLRAALARIAQQDARIAELEARRRSMSRNSSKPPSSEPPGAPPRKSTPTGRNPGYWPGHKSHQREPLLPEKVTEVVSVSAPECCLGCAGPLLRLEGTSPARIH